MPDFLESLLYKWPFAQIDVSHIEHNSRFRIAYTIRHKFKLLRRLIFPTAKQW